MLYKKLPVQIKIEPVTEDRTIQTLEGSQDIKVGQYLATGIKGEQYAFGQHVFDSYTPVEGRDGYYAKTVPVIVDAIQIDFPITIDRPDWVHSGKAGDYLLRAKAGDQYVCDREIFESTYVRCDEFGNEKSA